MCGGGRNSRCALQGMPDEHRGTHCLASPPQGGTSTWFEGNVKISVDGLLLAGNDDQRM